MFASSGGLFVVKDDSERAQCERFCAIGSGPPYVAGAACALMPGSCDAAEIARTAVEAAIAFDTGCGGEVRTVEIG